MSSSMIAAAVTPAVPAWLRRPAHIAREGIVPVPKISARNADVKCRAGKIVDGTWVEMSDCAAAIENGNDMFADGDYAGAMKTFQGALKLEGN